MARCVENQQQKYQKRENEAKCFIESTWGHKANNDRSLIIIKTVLLVLVSYWVPMETSILVLWKIHTKTWACKSSFYVVCNFLKQPILTYPLSCLKTFLSGNGWFQVSLNKSSAKSLLVPTWREMKPEILYGVSHWQTK